MKCKKCGGRGRIEIVSEEVLGYKICDDCNGVGEKSFINCFIDFMADPTGMPTKDIKKELKKSAKARK